MRVWSPELKFPLDTRTVAFSTCSQTQCYVLNLPAIKENMSRIFFNKLTDVLRREYVEESERQEIISKKEIVKV